MKATHIRIKTNQRVIVEKQYDVLIVRNLRGKFLGAYEPKELAIFHKRYVPIKIKGR